MTHPGRKIALALSALTLLAIGGLILFAPQTLHDLNGIKLDPSPAMMSEIRAPGGLILVIGLFACAGLLWTSLERMALQAASLILLTYGVSRLVSLPLDGIPPEGLLAAMVIEIGLGTWCALLSRPWTMPLQTAS